MKVREKLRKALSLVLASAMTIGLLGTTGLGTNVAQADSSTFTLYVYYEGSETLYGYTKNWDALSFSGGETVTGFWSGSWNEWVAPFSAVEGTDKWYSYDFTIEDASASSEWFGVYAGNGDDDNIVIGYDASSSGWSTLVGGSSSEYAYYDGTLYTSLSDAQEAVEAAGEGEEEEEESAVSLSDLQALYDSVKSVTNDDGEFTSDSYEAFSIALADVQDFLDNYTSSQAADIEVMYDELCGGINSLLVAGVVNIDRVDNISEDTIRGMDISSYISIMDAFDSLNASAGSTTYGFRKTEGGEVMSRQEFFNYLAEQGVNYVRIRVWNDPYDESGNGYGGGNNDLDKAVEMGQLATNAGMKVLIDFHFSDFWADPSKQQVPKAWSEYTTAQITSAISSYTTSSLQTLLDAGVDVGMVQIGNETNGSFCGSSDWSVMSAYFDAGCDAVHSVASSYNKTILAVLHFTNPEASGRQAGYAANLNTYGVSYDVFATSYYPYWHGSLSNLTSVLTTIAQKYGVKVMVAETSYANTLDDVDGHDNTVRTGNNDSSSDCPWSFTVQGQAYEFANVLDAVTSVKDSAGNVAGLGAFYWEGAWVGVQDVYDEDGKVDATLLAANKTLWETYGCGWASSYAGDYDPDDAGVWYGGSAVDNQAFFDENGVALDSLKAFNYDYLKYGATTGVTTIDGYTALTTSIKVGDQLTSDTLGSVTVIYSDNTTGTEAVNWSSTDLAALNTAAASTAGIGSYIINGTLVSDATFEVTATVTVWPTSSLLSDYSFEDTSDSTSWSFSASGTAKTTDDPYDGTHSTHYWYESATTVTVSQTVTLAEAGTYQGMIFAQGYSGDTITLDVTSGGSSITTADTVTLKGWENWQTPKVEFTTTAANTTVTYTITINAQDGGWGTLDCAYLYLVEDSSNSNITNGYEAHLAGYSLDLSGTIGVDFYMELSSTVLNADDAKFVVDFPAKSVEMDLDEADYVLVNGIGYFVFSCDVAAKEMTDNMTAYITIGDNAVGTQYSFNVQGYANYILNNSSNYDSETIALVKALLNYGAASQTFFGYNTDELANSVLDEADQTISAADLSSYAYTMTGSSEDVTYSGMSLVLESETTMKLYMKLASGVDPDEVSITVDGEDMSGSLVQSGKYYYLPLTDINATELGTAMTVEIDGLKFTNLSALTYCKAAAATTNTKLVDVANALYAFHQAASALADK